MNARPIKILVNRNSPGRIYQVYEAVDGFCRVECCFQVSKVVIGSELIRESDIRGWLKLKQWNEFVVLDNRPLKRSKYTAVSGDVKDDQSPDDAKIPHKPTKAEIRHLKKVALYKRQSDFLNRKRREVQHEDKR
jgi:hypothetical protein